MAMMPASWLLVVMMIVGQGGNHLLDYASTTAYWKSHDVEVTVGHMTELLKPQTADVTAMLVDLASPDAQVRAMATEKIRAMGPAALDSLDAASQLNDPQISATCKALAREMRQKDKPGAVQRLMAIRALGELKKPEALPTLQRLLKSNEMFVAEYAARAIAQIKGTPVPEPDQRALRRADADLLPAGARAVAQQSLPPSFADVEQLIAAVGPVPGVDKAEATAKLTSAVLEIAERTGDIRVDSITMGVAGDVGNNSGWVAVLVRGEFDAAAVNAWIHAQTPGMKSRTAGAVDVFTPEDEVAFAVVNDRRGVFTAGPSADQLPIDGLLRSIQTGKGELLEQAEMKPLLGKVDMSLPLWGVMKVTDAFRQAPPLAPLDEVVLAGRTEGMKLNLTIKASGSDAQGVKNTVDMVNGGVEQALKELQNQGTRAMILPGTAQAREFLQTVKCQAKDTDATLTATVNRETLVPVFSLFFFGRAMPMEAPPAVQNAQPAPVAPHK